MGSEMCIRDRDVVFILLIFFVVTAVFIKERGVEVSRSDNDQSNIIDLEPVVVHLLGNGKIRIDDEYVSTLSLRARMQAHHAEFPEMGAIISAHPDVNMETFTSALDAARQVFGHDEIVLDLKA